MSQADALDGVLAVDKPRGPTSHDVINIARRALRTRRIGHTGTLDPFASGLLLLCIGPATRIAEYITGMDKRYRAVVRLGVRTDTDDDTGAVLEERAAGNVGRADIERVLERFRGTIEQVPPQFSAKKVAGERAYQIARGGGIADLAAVRVTVHALDVVRWEPPELALDIRCSSGTYIRSIARDLGDALNVGAHLTALRRTAIGEHALDDAVPLDGLANDPSAAIAKMISSLDALSDMPRVDIDDAAVEHIRHGRAIPQSTATTGTVALAAHGRLVAIADARDGVVQPRKVFV